MPRPKRYVKCEGCGTRFQAKNKRARYHSQRCYLDATKNKRKDMNRVFFDGERVLEREETFRAVDQKFEDKYGKGSL